jgi:hypothetical protein
MEQTDRLSAKTMKVSDRGSRVFCSINGYCRDPGSEQANAARQSKAEESPASGHTGA